MKFLLIRFHTSSCDGDFFYTGSCVVKADICLVRVSGFVSRIPMYRSFWLMARYLSRQISCLAAYIYSTLTPFAGVIYVGLKKFFLAIGTYKPT